MFTSAHTGGLSRESAARAGLAVRALGAGDEPEALRFLGARPLNTVMLAGLIRDNGLSSPLNRGTFYGCRDARGRLRGVALVGYVTLVEARSEAALAALAEPVRAAAHVHLIIGEAGRIRRFWPHYAQTGQAARTSGQELMFVRRQPMAAHEPAHGLRPATATDLELVMAAHARLAESESGVNMLEVDPVGFRARTARRVAQERVWVWIEEGRLIFKADVVCETPEAFYLEGIYVDAAVRGRGYGLRCLSQLSRLLLQRTESLCLLVNERNHGAQAFYRRVGFRLHSRFETIYL
jgi:predicted GNAT family acetyltransferase